jgi:hypothetical protein
MPTLAIQRLFKIAQHRDILIARVGLGQLSQRFLANREGAGPRTVENISGYSASWLFSS